MYTNDNNANRYDAISHIEENDIYNSKLLKLFKDKISAKSSYTRSKVDQRTDIVAESVFGSSDKESFLYLMDHDAYSLPKSFSISDQSIDEILSILGV